jgi:CheY-like chemotaxis protein
LLELMEDARQLAAGTPIVGCSVAAPESRALSAGADGYLIKPVRRQDLADLLGRVERRVGGAVRRVLVVDDDPDVLRLFRRMLDAQSDALSVITAPSAQAALTALAEDVPDLILLDAMMPAMSGWDLLGHVRADPRLERVPTYFVSGQDPADEVPRSDLLLVTCDQGMSLKKLVRCSLEAATILLGRDAMPDPAPAETSGVAPASKERLQLPAR